MSDVDIVLKIATDGVEGIYKLSNAMTQLNRAVNGVSNPMKNLDARSRALSQAVGSADSSLKSHAKTLGQVARNNSVLTNEMGRVRKDLVNLGKQYTVASGQSAAFSKAGIKDLQNYQKALKGIRIGALVQDLRSVSQEQKRLGKDAQFVGRSLIIGLTTPILAFGRYGLQSVVAVDKEFVRLNKILEGVAPNLEAAAIKMDGFASAKQLNKMVDTFNQLDKSLSATSNKFGIAKSLTVGLAADFAELGIQTADSIAKITELTAVTEKLGSMDIGAAKDLVQSLYFQARRAMSQSGETTDITKGKNLSAAETEGLKKGTLTSSAIIEARAIEAATAQLNLFNIIENQTALSMKDIAKAFPEVASAATTFGLSMTEAASLLAPMKAAGLEVGASANGIKFSLQSLVNPTVKTEKLFATLTDQYGDHFKLVRGSGIDAIQALIGSYQALSKAGGPGNEGILEFFSQVFGKRQGTRMLLPIQQLAEFDDVLKDVNKSTTSADARLQGFANNAILTANTTKNAQLPLIKSYKDIAIIARIATAQAGKAVEGFSTSVTQTQIDEAIKVRNAVADGIKTVSNTESIDLIGQTATEAGKAMYVQLAGVKNAQEVADRELTTALGSLDVTIQRVKNTFKNFATDIIKIVRPGIEKIAEVAGKLYDSWQRLTPATKEFISKLVVGIGLATASIGPLIFALGQMRLAFGSVSKVIFAFLPSLKTMTVEMVASNTKMLNLSKPLTVMGDTVVNNSGKFSTFIATIASGGGPLGKFAEKIGLVTGVLQKQTTANIALSKSVFELNSARETATTADLMSTFIEPKKEIKRGAAGATRLEREARELSTAVPKPAGPTRIARTGAKTFTENIALEQRRIAKTAGFSPLQIQESLAPKQRYKYASSIQAEMKRLQLDAAKAIGATDSEIIEAFNRLDGKIKTAANKRMRNIIAAVNPKTNDFKSAAQASRKSARNIFETTETARRAPALLMDSERLNAVQAVKQNAKVAQQARIQAQMDRQKQRIQDRLAAQQARVQAQFARSAGVGQSKIQQVALGKRGIELDRDTGIKTFKGRVISDDRASDLYAGKARARVAEFGGRAKEMVTGKAGDIGGFAKSLNPVKAYKASIAGAKASVEALTAEHVRAGVAGPTALARMKVAMHGFVTSTTLGTKALKILKFAMISSGIGAILLAIGVGFILIKNNMDKFKEAGGAGLKVVGDAFRVVKNAALEIVRPIVDLFAHFGSGSAGSAGAVEGIGNAFNKVAGVIKFVANMFAMVVKKFIQPYLYMIVNIVAAVVSLFQGNWKKAFSYLMTAVAFAVDYFVNVFALGFKLIVSLAGGLVKGVVSILGMLGKLIIENTVAPITAVLKVASMLPLGIGDKFKGINDKFRGVVNGAKGLVDSATGTVNGVVDAATKGTNGLIDKAAGGLKKKVEGLKKGGINISTGKVTLGGKKPVLEVDTGPAQEKIANDIGTGIEEGADKGAKALAKKLASYSKSLKEELQNDIQDRIKNIMKDVVDKLTDGLKDQKEASLKLFDDQLSKIEETAKAEERLTKTKEYENKKREMEEKRALNQLNSQRNYQLAIYEGRIDDARQISLEGKKSESESQKEVADLETSRSQELADQRKSDLIESIKDAKDIASKYFDDAIKGFTDAAKKITEFPPTTAAKFNEQLEKLKTAANTYGTNAGGSFAGTFVGSLATLGVDATAPLTDGLAAIAQTILDNNPFGENGVWQTTIDASIEGLKQKYIGLSETLNTAVGESSGAFKELFDIYTQYKDLVATNEAEGADTAGGTTGGTTGGGTGGGTGDGTGGGTGSSTDKQSPAERMAGALMANYRASNGEFVKNNLIAAFKYAGAQSSKPTGGPYADSVFKKFVAKYPVLSNKSNSTALKVIQSLFNRGIVPGAVKGLRYYNNGGFVPGVASKAVPAVLHGGEYVVNSNAVKNIGLVALQAMNDMRFNTPKTPAYAGPVQPQQNSTSSVNIYVDNFIGEKKWFESMMKEYNINIGPQNQKNAGLQNRTISTYNGLNRGL